ncbi:MAG: glycosyltransferase family 9 protein [Cytophagales bacterium]|nr:MAG: glycosyltransferase family 9 protein [Cytophagales bacterium]
MSKKILLIQTAFLGDVILATILIEKCKAFFPEAQIDFLVRDGNQSILEEHPHLSNVWVWNKKNAKLKEITRIISLIRAQKYDFVLNAQRFFTTGLFTYFSNAHTTVGFDKNPLSFLFHKKVAYKRAANIHEVERNFALVASITDEQPAAICLYPTEKHYQNIRPLQTNPYICIAPTSVWNTKQFPEQQWLQLVDLLTENFTIYLIGSKSDASFCQQIREKAKQPQKVENMAGKLHLLEVAALMEKAAMNYANDSAPTHIASAMKAPITTIFCSTIPAFGYSPLGEKAKIVETTKTLDCRPCGVHGQKGCPKGHFDCAYTITMEQLLAGL